MVRKQNNLDVQGKIITLKNHKLTRRT